MWMAGVKNNSSDIKMIFWGVGFKQASWGFGNCFPNYCCIQSKYGFEFDS